MANYRHKHSSKYPKTMSLSWSCMKHLGNFHFYKDRFKHSTAVKLQAAKYAEKEALENS
jgi:hypothetical protein